MKSLPSYITVHDQFCGAGGNSIAVEAEGGEVVRCWNHNAIAIDTHSANFPKTEHELTDIFTVDPRDYEQATMLITSPDCTNHTDANGKKKPTNQLSMFEDDEPDPTEERSRMTMAQVVRFAEVLKYEAIIVENVEQVRKWRYWEVWLQSLRGLDYNIQIVHWNSAFFAPTPQSRDRLYVVCTKKHLPLPDLTFRPAAWCMNCQRDVEAVQVWRKPNQPYGKWRFQYDYRCPNSRCGRVVIPYYHAAFNIIDWSLPSPKIGERDKPLKPNTMRRIQAGLDRFATQPGLVDLAWAHGQNLRVWPLTMPYATQTTVEARGLYVPPFLLGQQTNATAKSVADQMPAISSAGAISLTTPPFMVSAGGPEVAPRPMSEPMNTILVRDHMGVVMPPFMVPLDRGGDTKNPEPLTGPLSTQTTRQDKALFVPPFMVELRNHGDARQLTELLATITASGNHHGLLTPGPFIASYYGADGGHPLTEPLPTQPALEHHALVSPPFLGQYYGGRDAVSPLTEAVPTVTPEPRHTLITPGDQLSVEECGFRMLHWREVRRGMAFPETYIIKGNRRQIVNQLGNAVTPPPVRRLVNAVFAVLNPRQV